MAITTGVPQGSILGPLGGDDIDNGTVDMV